MDSAFALFLFAILAVFASAIWKRRTQLARERFIDQFDYARLIDARLAMKHPELDPNQRKTLYRGLAEYMQLCRMAGKRHMVSMPSQAVDDAWHEFILFTRNYESFCQRALGRFLHHIPAEAMHTPTQAQDGIKRAWRLACQREGINPKRPQRLPMLFSIDRDLGIRNGFYYVPDCTSQIRRADTTGTVYCGSHVGCGGGCSGSSDSGGDGGGGCGGGGD